MIWAYNILFEQTMSGLIDLVEANCKAGWMPTGGVCVVAGSGYYQAMVKEVPE